MAHGVARRFIDLRLGWSMMRSREIPASKKSLAIAIGIVATGVLFVLEVPLEILLFFLLPVDIAIDGLELVLVPLLIALAVLPHLCRQSAPVEVVE
jgi:hypothetical protein